MMTLDEFKRRLLDTGIFKKVSSQGQYRCDCCPYCGDMKKHMYVLINLNDDSPVVYHCFKCTKSGFINDKFLEYYGIDGLQIPKMRNAKNYVKSQNPSGDKIQLFSEEKDIDMLHKASDYIHGRVDMEPSVDELEMFQVIGNPVEYAQKYLGRDGRGLENRIWFRLCNGNMIGRNLTNTGERWKKCNSIYKNNDNAYGTYLIRKPVRLYDCLPTLVHIAEGVMDCIGLYYLGTMEGDVDQSVFIGVMGRDYTLGIKQAIDMGLFGDSVIVKIMKDRDVDKVVIPDKYRLLFKSISVYQNARDKDFGVPFTKNLPERML